MMSHSQSMVDEDITSPIFGDFAPTKPTSTNKKDQKIENRSSMDQKIYKQAKEPKGFLQPSESDRSNKKGKRDNKANTSLQQPQDDSVNEDVDSDLSIDFADLVHIKLNEKTMAEKERDQQEGFFEHTENIFHTNYEDDKNEKKYRYGGMVGDIEDQLLIQNDHDPMMEAVSFKKRKKDKKEKKDKKDKKHKNNKKLTLISEENEERNMTSLNSVIHESEGTVRKMKTSNESYE